MRHISLAISLLGLFVLLIILQRDPIAVTSLEELREGEVVKLRGTVSAVDSWGDELKFVSSDFFFVCDCPTSLLNEEVIVEGSLEIFQDYRYIRALRIKIIETQ